MFESPAANARAARLDVDADLMRALRLDDPGATDQLVERYGDRVYRLAFRITGLREDAEEVAQDARWTAARRIDTFRGASAFGSWMYRITANAAYQKLRARRRRGPEIALDEALPPLDAEGRTLTPIEDWSSRVGEHAVQEEMRQVLTDAIDALPPDYRTVLVLHDAEGVSNPDIAAALGLSLPAVTSRVHRSRLLVRQRLAEYFASARMP